MDFIDQLKQFGQRVASMKDTIQTEEATKTAIIMPFFSMLGYDVFNPQEFVPEFTADVGIKKGEKIDYAIMINGEPMMLVECKSINENLGKHASQLFRYFGTSAAKFAILTNGIIYHFYTDLDNQNKMDEHPFLSIDILNIKDNQVGELKKFCKAVFDVDAIFSTASELKYVHEFKRVLANQIEMPDDDFTRFFLQHCYTGQKNQNVIEKFRPLLRKALADFISETMNDKIKAAFSTEPMPQAETAELAPAAVAVGEAQPERRAAQVETTEEELEAYFIVKNMLKDQVSMRDITYKDTSSYFNILYQGNTRKWICRIRINSSSKTLILPDENKKEIMIPLEGVYDLEAYSEQLKEVLVRYL